MGTWLGWTDEERVALCKAYLSTSLDPVKGADQSGLTFWASVVAAWKGLLAGRPGVRRRTERGVGGVQKQWEKIRKGLNEFGSHYMAVKRMELTGNPSDEDMISAAMARYCGANVYEAIHKDRTADKAKGKATKRKAKQGHCPWVLCWRVLRHVDKFTMRTMAFLWCLFFLCATITRIVIRTGKTLRGTTRVMMIATRRTSSVLECVLDSDFKGKLFSPPGRFIFSYLLRLCVRQRVSLSRRSRVAHHASSGRGLRDSRSATRRNADFAPMLSCRAVPFERRRRRRVSNNCACVAPAAFGQVYHSNGSQGRLHETRSRLHTDVRKKKPRGGKKKPLFVS